MTPDRRQSAHEDCLAHSGMMTKLNLNLFLQSVGVVGVGVVLITLISMNTDQAITADRLAKNEVRTEKLEEGMSRIETRIDRLESTSRRYHDE